MTRNTGCLGRSRSTSAGLVGHLHRLGAAPSNSIRSSAAPQPRNTTGAARNARGLYEVALLNSADPTHAPPPGLPRLLYEQALLERAGQVTVDREQEWLAMAARNARVLYEVALLRSANPTHALMGDPPPG